MSIILDLILIGIVLLSTFLGYKKGLIGVAFKIVSFVIAIVITLILFIPVSNFIVDNTDWDEKLETSIVTTLSNSNIEEEKALKEEETNLPNIAVNYINSTIKDTIATTQNNVVEAVSRDLAINIIKIGTMVVLFIIARIALLFAKAIMEGIAELPIIKQFNEVGGIIYGVLRGILVIYLLLLIVSLIVPMLNNQVILEIIEKTILCKFMYNNNILLGIFL